ncbi:hypothetical protein BC830DRAFT_1162865 [Chytriomyces sp. MP71]|nr:hypothetical protein BC830DRAFT_1162865 [Chytriomyces sp. MP71]
MALTLRDARVYVRRPVAAGEREGDGVLPDAWAQGHAADATSDGLEPYRRITEATPLLIDLHEGGVFHIYGIFLLQLHPDVIYNKLIAEVSLMGSAFTKFVGLGLLTFSEQHTFLKIRNLLHDESEPLTPTGESPFLVLPFAIPVRTARKIPVTFTSPSCKIQYQLRFKVTARSSHNVRLESEIVSPVRVIPPQFGNVPPPELPLRPSDDGIRMVLDASGNLQGNVSVAGHRDDDENSIIWLRPRVLTTSPSYEIQRPISPAYSEFDDQRGIVRSGSGLGSASIGRDNRSLTPITALDEKNLAAFVSPDDPVSRSETLTSREPASKHLGSLSSILQALQPLDTPQFHIVAPNTMGGPNLKIPIDVDISSVPARFQIVSLEVTLSAHVECTAMGTKREDKIELSKVTVEMAGSPVTFNDRIWIEIPDRDKLGAFAVPFQIKLVQLTHKLSFRLNTTRPSFLGGRGKRKQAFDLGTVSIEMIR